jgi:toxin secretion/phage lysis holin
MQPHNLTYVHKLVKGISENFDEKIFFAISYGVLSFLFDPLQHMSLIALLVLIIFDTITGVSAAFKSGEEIKSSKILRAAIKICFYFLFVSAGHLCETVIANFVPIQATITAMLALTELVSIMENMGKMGYTVPQTLLNKLKNLRDDPVAIVQK